MATTVNSFNNRTGSVTLQNSDVTAALAGTPVLPLNVLDYGAFSNKPNGFITGAITDGLLNVTSTPFGIGVTPGQTVTGPSIGDGTALVLTSQQSGNYIVGAVQSVLDPGSTANMTITQGGVISQVAATISGTTITIIEVFTNPPTGAFTPSTTTTVAGIGFSLAGGTYIYAIDTANPANNGVGTYALGNIISAGVALSAVSLGQNNSLTVIGTITSGSNTLSVGTLTSNSGVGLLEIGMLIQDSTGILPPNTIITKQLTSSVSGSLLGSLGNYLLSNSSTSTSTSLTGVATGPFLLGEVSAGSSTLSVIGNFLSNDSSIGQDINWSSNPFGTLQSQLVAQLSGLYLVSPSQAIPSSSMTVSPSTSASTTGTASMPSGLTNTLTVTSAAGTISVGQLIGPVPPFGTETFITAELTGSGEAGTYLISELNPLSASSTAISLARSALGTSTITGAVEGSTLTVTSAAAGSISPGLILSGSTALSNTLILHQASGTLGGAGTYIVGAPYTGIVVSSEMAVCYDSSPAFSNCFYQAGVASRAAYIPSGTFCLAQQVTFNTPNSIVIFGDGNAVTKINLFHADIGFNLLQQNPNGTIEIRNLEVVGAYLELSAAAFQLAYFGDVNPSESALIQSRVENIAMVSTGGVGSTMQGLICGFIINGGSNLRFTNVGFEGIVSNSGTANVGTAFQLFGPIDIHIDKFMVENALSVVSAGALTSPSFNNPTQSNNVVNPSTGGTVNFYSYMEGLYLNNGCVAGTDYVFVNPSGPSDKSTSLWGIALVVIGCELNTNYSCLLLNYWDDIRFIGNDVTNGQTLTAATYIQCSDVSKGEWLGNHFVGQFGETSSIQSTCFSFAFESLNCSSHSIVGNSFELFGNSGSSYPTVGKFLALGNNVFQVTFSNNQLDDASPDRFSVSTNVSYTNTHLISYFAAVPIASGSTVQAGALGGPLPLYLDATNEVVVSNLGTMRPASGSGILWNNGGILSIG